MQTAFSHGFDGRHQLHGRGGLAEVLKHHRRRPEGRDRVGDTFAGDVEGRTVDRFEHRREFARRVEVGGRRNAQAAGQSRGQVGKDIGVQVGGDDHVQCRRLEHHACGHGVDQFLVDLHVREVLGDFVENLVPQHHAMTLGVGLGDHGQVFTRAALCQFEGKAVNALHPGTGKYRHFGGDFFRQPPVYSTAVAGVLTFGVFPHHHPVDLVAIEQRAFHPGQHAGRAHVGVLVEALADRQAQAPQGNVIRYVERAHGTEENRVEGFQFFQAAFRNVVAVFQVVIRVPVEVFEIHFEGGFFRQGLQHLNACGDHFNTDAITWNRCNLVCAHAQLHSLDVLVVPVERAVQSGCERSICSEQIGVSYSESLHK
ncbi:hypothetical protein D3C76_673380 [compost metagenome]